MVDASIWGTSLLGVSVRHAICAVYLFIYFSSWLCCPLRSPNSPQTRWWEGVLVFGNFSSFKTPFLGRISIPNSFVSFFIFNILSYLLSKTMDCFFWVPDVLCQRSEVVLWNLLSIQMFFQWICGGESGLLILFLHILGPPQCSILKDVIWSLPWDWISMYKIIILALLCQVLCQPCVSSLNSYNHFI